MNARMSVAFETLKTRISVASTTFKQECRDGWTWIRSTALSPVPSYTRWGFYPQALIVLFSLIWLQLWPLMPTVAIGFLGVVAAIMTVRADRFTPVERGMYVLLAFALFIVEMKAVYRDRDEHDKQQAELQASEREARRMEEKSFAALLTEGRNLLGKTQEVETLTKMNLLNITGGESYALVTPQVWSGVVPIPLSIYNYGKQTLTGVTVVIRGRQNWDLNNPQRMYDLPTLNVGTLHAGELRLLKAAITPVEGEMKDDNDKVDFYDLDIAAQNFTVTEHLMFKRGKHVPWDFMYQATRQFVTSHTKTKTTFGYKIVATTKWMGD